MYTKLITLFFYFLYTLKLNKVIKKMHILNDMQRANVNQFFNSQKATITDIYRIDQSLERRKVSVQHIEYLLNQKASLLPNSSEYANVMSELAIETGMLKAIMQDTQKQLENMKTASQYQVKLSDKLLSGKRQILQLLSKLSSL